MPWKILRALRGGSFATDFAELRPRLVYDRDTGLLTARPGAQRLAVTSGGTIPDRGLFTVYLATDAEKPSRVGELDEEMVYESRPGDVIALGATSWRITEITHDRVLVVPAPGQPARLPFWRGDDAGRPAELGAAIAEISLGENATGPSPSTSWCWIAAASRTVLTAPPSSIRAPIRKATCRASPATTEITVRSADWRWTIAWNARSKAHARSASPCCRSASR